MTTNNKSVPLAVQAGKAYSWCRCGLSETMPLCDKSHQTSKTNALPPRAFVAQQTGTVFLCTCLRTEDPPYCDGFGCDNS